MGGVPCLIIIQDGQLAYAATEELGLKYSHVDTIFLEAAIKASCESISFVALYLHIDDEYIAENYTKPIIDLHNRIILEFPIVTKSDVQALVDELFDKLMIATRKLRKLLE